MLVDITNIASQIKAFNSLTDSHSIICSMSFTPSDNCFQFPNGFSPEIGNLKNNIRDIINFQFPNGFSR